MLSCLLVDIYKKKAKIIHFYRPQTGFRARYYFHRCLSVHRGKGGAVMLLPVMKSTSPLWDSTPFSQDSTCPYPHPVNKGAVHILLECFLVKTNFTAFQKFQNQNLLKDILSKFDFYLSSPSSIETFGWI